MTLAATRVPITVPTEPAAKMINSRPVDVNTRLQHAMAFTRRVTGADLAANVVQQTCAASALDCTTLGASHLRSAENSSRGTASGSRYLLTTPYTAGASLGITAHIRE